MCPLQASRDSVIAVYTDEGSEHRVSAEDVMLKKKILQEQFETEQRIKGGLEYERSVFEHDFKDQPEVLKAAKFYTVRVKCPKTGKMSLEQRTKIYEHKKGVCAFQELSGTSVKSQQVIDDGRFQLAEEQQERAFQDVVDAQMRTQRLEGSLTTEDVEEPAQKKRKKDQSDEPGSKRSRKDDGKPADGASSSEDDVAPFEAQLSLPGKKKPKPKARKGSGGGSGDTGGTGGTGGRGDGNGDGGGGGGLPSSTGSQDIGDKATEQLLEEVDRELVVFAQAENLDDIKLETINSLLQRLQSKRTQLGKKVGKSKTQKILNAITKVAERKTQFAAIADLVKTAIAFERKRIRFKALQLQDKLHLAKSAGLEHHQIPLCMRACGVYAGVAVASTDAKWDVCVSICANEKLKDSLGLVDTEGVVGEQLADIQMKAGSEFFAELLRQHAALSGNNLAVTRLKFLSLASDFKNAHAPMKELLDAGEVVLHHHQRKYSAADTRQALYRMYVVFECVHSNCA